MSEETVDVTDLTIDELLGFKQGVLIRELAFEVDINGKTEKMWRKVTFRRMTYGEIDKLRTIPDSEPLRYATAVIQTASISPKFEDTDQIAASPLGFVRNYNALILRESGKDPFLEKR